MRYLYILLVIAAFAGALEIFADSACAQQNPLFQHPAGQITTQVVSCLPAQNYTHAPLTGPLQITFAPGMQIIPASLTDSTFVVMGQQSGWHRSSSLTYDSASNTITYIPAKPFFVGELVTAVATKKIMYDTLGQQMYLHGFAWQFYGMVTRQTRATFRDTEHLQEEQNSNVGLTSLSDMDNDQNVDMVYATNRTDLKSSILFNSGDGVTFQKVMFGMPGGAYPADYNLQGEQDAIIGDDSGFIANNNGNRAFTYGSKQNFKGYFNAQIVDMDFDGRPEYIGEGLQAGTQVTFDSIYIYSVINDSIIKRQSIHVGINSGDGISAMFSGDFNNDGAIDVGVNISGRIYILYNDGTGNLLPPQQANSTVGAGMNGWTAADMDNDGLLDLAGAIIGLGVEIDHNNGDGTFTPIQSKNSNIPFSKQTVSYNFNVGDCNGDGLMDAILTPVDVQTDSMFFVSEKNMGNNSLVVEQIIPEGNAIGQLTDIFLGDMFHTSALDPVISFEESGTIVIFQNDSLVPPLSVIQNPATAPEGYALNENFPNPSSKVTNISYILPTTQIVNISIYNSIGQLMANVVNGLVANGSSEISYDCSTFPSGTYFVRLTAGSVSLAQQFAITH